MTDERDLVRQQFFDCDGPVDVDIELGSGSVEVRFADETDTGDGGGARTSGPDGTGSTGSSDDASVDETGSAGETGTVGETGSAGRTAAAQHNGPAETTFAGNSTFADDSGFADGTEFADDAGPADDPTVDGMDAEADRPSDPGRAWAGGGSQPAIVVEVRHEPRAGANWGLAGLLNWVGGQFGAQTTDLAAEAVRQTVVTVHGNRLTVRGPRPAPLRMVPLTIVVHAPAGSSLHAKAGSAGVQVGGLAGRVNVNTGSGNVSVDRASGHVQVKAGSGSVRLGPMADGLSARTGSGDLEVTSLDGNGSLHSGSGNIWIGTVRGEQVTMRTGSGDLTVAEAAKGALQLVTGSGDLRVGIRSGVLAEVDVVSGSGRARSDLPVSTEPPSRGADAVLRVRGRTGSGDAVVSAATA